VSGRRARRFGIVTKLMLVSVVLLALPWLARPYFAKLELFILEGQKSALALAAQAVASVLHDRDDLFDVEGAVPVPLRDCSPLPLAGPIQLDGNGRDWSERDERSCSFGRMGVAPAGDVPGDAGDSLDLALGQRDGHLYALFEVRDDVLRFRHPRHRNLDGSDHIRIVLPAADGSERRYLVTAERPGPITAYEVGESWRYALGDGLPVRDVRGTWAESPGGYTVELRMPLTMLPAKRLGFAVADVDGEAGAVLGLVGTVPSGAPDRIDSVRLPSPGIAHILRALHLPGARITVLDAQRHVRAEAGDDTPPVEPAQRERLVRGALAHRFGTRVAVAPVSGAAVTAAASPVRVGDRVMGAVLIEQSNREILGLQRREFERAFDAVVAASAAIAVLLWLFAWRLAWRIHRLRDEAGAAIDPDGRVLRVSLRTGRRAGDEIGDLSRTVSGLLGRLARYTGFLEQIPRTLRHELSNPLNGLSTSLQNLVVEHPELVDSKYVHSAERGVARIGEIVQGLTDAASLEQALRDDERERFDLATLVARYVENFAAGCPRRRFTLRGAEAPAPVRGSGFRIEQLLDKLVDNAVTFSPEGSEIALALHVDSGVARLCVSNSGPPLPAALRGRLFDSTVSSHAAGEQPHLGIGLYVARLIAEHMGGRISARDRDDGGGVVFCVELPLAAAAVGVG